MTQHVLITGCSTGIGLQTAAHLVQKGFIVHAAVRKTADFAQVEAVRAQPILLDVSDEASMQQAIATLSAELEGTGLHALVNNAGFNYVAPFELTDQDKFRQMMEVNVFGLARLSQLALPLLQLSYQKSGQRAKLVNISSIGGSIGLPWEFAYHTSKWAVNGLSQSLAFELNPLGIDVTAVQPGGIKTPFWDKSFQSYEDAMKNASTPNFAYYEHNRQNFSKVAAELYKHASEPHLVADTVAKVIMAKKAPFRIRVGTDAKILYFLIRLLPASWLHGMMQSRMATLPK